MVQDWSVEVTHLGGMRLRAQCGPHAFDMDYPVQDGDPGKGATPLQVLAASLAGCAANSVAVCLRKGGHPLKHLAVTAQVQRRATHPTVLTHIHLVFHVSGPSAEAAVEALQRSEDLLCPVWAMLRPGVEISNALELGEQRVPVAGR